MIKVYTLPNCVKCIELKKFLNMQKCDYKEFDLSTDKIAYNYVTKLKVHGLPYIEGDGWSMVGFNKHELAKKLKIEHDIVRKRLQDMGFM